MSLFLVVGRSSAAIKKHSHKELEHATYTHSQYDCSSKHWNTLNMGPVPTVPENAATGPGNSDQEIQYLVLVRYMCMLPMCRGPLKGYSWQTASLAETPSTRGSVTFFSSSGPGSTQSIKAEG